MGAGVGDKNVETCGVVPHSAFHWWSAQFAARMLLSAEVMSYCAAGANGCLDLRHCASALDRRTSTEWSRSPGSMPRRPRDSGAPLQRSSAGWMPARIGRLSAGVGCRHPVTVHKASLMAGTTRRVQTLAADRSAVDLLRSWMHQG